jgi:hypothetical protein
VAPAAEAIHSICSGHPYLTNRFIAGIQAGDSPETTLEILVRGEDAHMRHIGRRLRELGDPVTDLAQAVLTGEIVPYVSQFDSRLDALIVLGIVRGDHDGNTRIRCGVYERYLSRLGGHPARGARAAVSVPATLNAIQETALRDHVGVLLATAPGVAGRSPALAAICMGSVLEAVLLSKLEACGNLQAEVDQFNSELTSGKIDGLPKITKRQPRHWDLAQMIEIARIRGFVSKPSSQVSHAIRDWRNLIHPDKFRRNYPNGVSQELGEVAIASCHLILNELR